MSHFLSKNKSFYLTLVTLDTIKHLILNDLEQFIIIKPMRKFFSRRQKKSIQILPVASLNNSELNLFKFELEDDEPV